jgi:hypothetical protein
MTLKARGYPPDGLLQRQPELREVIDLIRSGFFSRGDTELFRPLIDGLLYHDPYIAGRFPVLCRMPGEGVRSLPRRRALDANVDPQHRAQRQVLIRPDDPRILRGDLARQIRADHLLTHAEAGIA